jgi:hypothetical protein
MILRCRRAFGNFLEGDTVEVPEGAVFDEYFFERVTASEGDDDGS